MEELFNKYVLPNLIVIDAEDSIDGEPIYVSDLDKIKADFQNDLREYVQEAVDEQTEKDRQEYLDA